MSVLTADQRHRPKPAAAFARPSFALLTRVELRKTVDTRAGRVLLGLTLLLSAVALGYLVTRSATEGLEYARYVGVATSPVVLLVPVLGVLAMASEWTQRTVLTTFTVTPRRIRVLAAKLVAAVALGLVVTAAVDAAAALALVVRAAVAGAPATWEGVGSIVGGSVVTVALALVMGAALGALVMQTAVAIAAYYVVPNLVVLAVSSLRESLLPYVDVSSAFEALARFDVSGHVGEIASSLLLWVALPLALGVWRSVRRNVS